MLIYRRCGNFSFHITSLTSPSHHITYLTSHTLGLPVTYLTYVRPRLRLAEPSSSSQVAYDGHSGILQHDCLTYTGFLEELEYLEIKLPHIHWVARQNKLEMSRDKDEVN